MKCSWLDIALWIVAMLLLIPSVLHVAQSVRLVLEGLP